MQSDIRSEELLPGDHDRSGAGPRPAGLGGEVRAVLSRARRRAVLDADHEMDTAHLLHSLLEADPRAREALDSGDGRAVRVLGYLAQRSIGYGMRWHGAAEEGTAGAAAAGTVPGMSCAATAALREATRRATVRGSRTVEGTDLLRALAADPRCRAVEVLRAAGVDPQRLAVAPRSRRRPS